MSNSIKKEENVKTYLELISRDEVETKREDLKIKAQEAALELSKYILVLTQKVNTLKLALERSKSAIPYNVTEEFKFKKALDLIQEELKFVEDIRNTRFTDAQI